MALHKIKDFDADYRDNSNENVLGFDLYSRNEKIGSVDDLLVDDSGNFRYFVVNTGVWIFGKKVLLPVGRARVSYDDHRVYVDTLSRSQVENLPAYDENTVADQGYQERVRGVYRSDAATGAAMGSTAATGNAPLDTAASLDNAATPAYSGAAYDQDVSDRQDMSDRDRYAYDRDPDLYNLNEQNHRQLKLYEERLIANKTRQKTGEVAVGKRVETETARVSVPIEKERIVVERMPADAAGTPVNASDTDFQEGEVARMEVYEEVPEIHKETVVRENVNIRKEVDRDTAEVEDQLRREELDVNTQGQPVVDRRPDQRNRI